MVKVVTSLYAPLGKQTYQGGVRVKTAKVGYKLSISRLDQALPNTQAFIIRDTQLKYLVISVEYDIVKIPSNVRNYVRILIVAIPNKGFPGFLLDSKQPSYIFSPIKTPWYQVFLKVFR